MRRTILAVAMAAATGAALLGAVAQGADQDMQISASVPGYCTVGGTHSPTKLSTSIPVDAAGSVDTTLQTFTVGSVVCNTPTNLTATSMRGGVKSATKVGSSGLTNIINYKGTATFGTAKSTINTGATKGASGPETGNTATTAGPTSGNLTITILPDQPTSPLALGSDYWDTLRVDLIPD